MKIHITTPGDKSVGIWGDVIEITMDRDLPQDTEERNGMRKSLADFFTDFCDNGKAQVAFDDECPECGAVMEWRPNMFGYEGCYVCMNQNCLSNIPALGDE